jgi:hypothetical protein
VPLQTQNARAQNQVSEGHSFVILNLFQDDEGVTRLPHRACPTLFPCPIPGALLNKRGHALFLIFSAK